MLAQAIRSVFKAAGQGPLSDFWYRPLSTPTASGVTISDDTALAVSTWFACVRILSDTVGALPIFVYRRESEERKTRDPEHQWYKTLHNRPNAWQSPMTFKSMLVSHLLLRGNFYARIDPPNEWTQGPALTPLSPDRMDAPKQLSDGSLIYHYRYKDADARDYSQDQILHVRLLTLDGVTGISPLTYAREVLGLASAQTSYAASLFGGGGFIKYYLKTTKRLGAEGRKNFREGWRDLHGNASKFEPPILEDDMTINTLGMSNEDAQFLESRKFSAYEICQFLGVPPHMVFLLDRATFSNIEHQAIEFANVHLNPYLVRVEQELQPWLGESHFAEFLREAIVRGDLMSRYQAYNIGLQAGFLTRNEVRTRENLDPVEGGDELMEPLNMAPAGQRGQPPEEPEEPEEDDAEEEASAGAVPVIAEAVETAPGPPFDIRPVIADAASRIVHTEVSALQRHLRRDWPHTAPAAFFQWAVNWYEKHRDYTARTLTPVIAATGSGADPQECAIRYCDESVQQLAQQPLDAILSDWETTKAGRLAATLEATLCTITS